MEIGERVNLLKTGSGTLAVSGAALSAASDLTISGGTVVLSDSACSTYGTVTIKSGATLDASECDFSCANLVRESGGTFLHKPIATAIIMR